MMNSPAEIDLLSFLILQLATHGSLMSQSQSSPRPLFPVQWTSVPSASHGHPQVLTSGSLAVAITSSRNKALRHRLIMMLVVIVMMFPSTAHVPVMIMPALVPPPLLRSTLERRKNRTDFIH
ncbi:hypothetical protein J6590_046389 [Homalodisca vitripennis]|nr:hypothetical protein J6590_046389 [Homalodisca vitripennis]